MTLKMSVTLVKLYETASRKPLRMYLRLSVMAVQAGRRVMMLSEQYRMHPAISSWPSTYFYDSLLRDGEGITPLTRRATFHDHPCFPPFAFFDCE